MNSKDKDEPDQNQEERASEDNSKPGKKSWVDEFDLVINCIGYSVGLGNIWRFPYLAYKNGGGSFLIPYILLNFLVTYPLSYMELLMSQISKLDPVTVWSFCPCFKGVGITILLCTVCVQVYYNIIMAYALFYVVQTFRAVLPWSNCSKWWGATEGCYENQEGLVLCKGISNLLKNGSNVNCTNATESSSDQFFKHYVLGLSSGIDDPGTIKGDLALVHLATAIIIGLLVILRHHVQTKTKFKTIYVTAVFPFIVLALFFFSAISLPGSGTGLKKLFIPKWSLLLEGRVWSEAATASLYSVGVGMGGLIMFGRKQDLSLNGSKCTLISASVDAFAGVFAATVTFMIVGNLSEKFNLEFSETTLSGQGLVFVTYADAVLHSPFPHLWSFLFFSMLFCLAIDVKAAVVETLTLSWRVVLCPLNTRTRIHVVLVTVFLFLAGLVFVTNGGGFLLSLFDVFAGGHSLIGTVMVESIAFAWGYGGKSGFKDFTVMEHTKPRLLMKLCWIVFAPITLIVLFILTLKEAHLVPFYGIPYPAYANIIGWVMVAIIMTPVPLWMVISFYLNRKKISGAFDPDEVWETAVYQTKQREKSA